jgi:hypothetical protein
MNDTARSRALSRIRQVSFPGSAFASTRHAAIKKELAERLVCPHIPAGAAIYHWYEHSKDEVHVYLCHFSFDEVKPGMDIPVDWDIRLRSNVDERVIAPIGLELSIGNSEPLKPGFWQTATYTRGEHSETVEADSVKPINIDKMAIAPPGEFRESAPVEDKFKTEYGWVEVGQYRTLQEAIEGAKKAVADQEKEKTWRDRAIEDPML